MPATRDGKTWRSQFYYEDWQGVRHKKNKRGFKTKAEAEEWERNFRQQQRKDLDINFDNFVEIYFADKKYCEDNNIKLNIYLKAALMKNYKKYPNLIVYEDGKYEFKVSFLNRTKRMSYFILRSVDGASAMKNIYNCYVGKNQYPNMVKFFYSKSNIRPTNPVILVFDNENVMKSKPLYDFLNYISFGDRETFKSRCRIIENLSLVTNPLVKGKKECEIEDLFDDDVLNVKISGKTFKRDTEKDNSMYFGKAIFANYVYKNYSKINFDKFISMLDDINNVIKEYQSER